MNSPLSDIHAERKQCKQQHCAKQCIERRVSAQLPAQGTKCIVCKAKSKSRQNRCGELRELERNVKVHLSEKPLPEAARGSFVLVAELAYAALDAQLTGIKTYSAYMQSAASHN